MIKLLRPFLFLFILISVIFSSCTKEEIIEKDVYTDTVITGNSAPDYNGVSNVTVKTFVNKAYIDIIGREPLDNEMDAALITLYNNDLNDKAKKDITADLMNTQAYHDKLFEKTSERMLLGTDSSDIYLYINVLTIEKDKQDTSGNYIYPEQQREQLQYEIDRLTALGNAKSDYRQGIISYNEYLARFLQNFFYDDINMGSENFVKATFEHLLHRLPTSAELNASVTMVDGFPSNLFLQSGTGKEDFVNIITNCNEYYEGLVYEVYDDLLIREPTTVEMSLYTDSVKTNNDFELLQQSIIIIEEYAGF